MPDATAKLSPANTKMKVAALESNIDSFGHEVSSFFDLNEDQKAAIQKHKLFNLVPESRSPVCQATTDKIKYEGQLLEAHKEGVGHLSTDEGDFIVCTFKKDFAEGEGAIYFKNGDYYKGHIANNQPHGTGLYLYKDGRKYEGGFANGQKEGFGIFNWLDGSKYEGQWSKVQQGHGKFTTANGKVVEGEFHQGKKLK